MVLFESWVEGTVFKPFSSGSGTGTLPTDVKLTEEEEEEEKRCRKNQATIAQLLKRRTARRLLGVGLSNTAKEQTNCTFSCSPSVPLELVMHEEQWVTKLTGLAILPKIGDGTILGTLEAHLNGFTYKALGIYLVLMHRNVQEYLWRLGDKMMPPLLQFRLKNSIMVGTKDTKDIQFYLVPTPDVHSDNTEKHKQTRDSSCNEDLKNFVHKAQEAQRTCGSKLPFIHIDFQALEECKFYGEFPTGASAIFAVTKFSLVVLEETPFIVIPLIQDIEIVNLAQLGPENFDMTVVFKDFKRDVLEIRSIPLEFLTSIKRRLNTGCVKYYVNNKSLKWNSLVKEIAEFPKRFIDSGGWDSLHLEDYLTLAYYPSASCDLTKSDAQAARLEKYKNVCF